MTPAVETVPEIEQDPLVVVVGPIFAWGRRSVVGIKAPTPVALEVRGGPIVIGCKPARWWHARAWLRVMRQLWRLP